MKPLKLHSWAAVNQSGDHFLNVLEQDIRDCYIRGKTDVQILTKNFAYNVITCPIKEVFNCDRGFFIRAVNDDVFELVGEPSNDYARFFHTDRARFAQIVTKKLLVR